MKKYYWLNKESIQFLKSGYLEEGETATQRVWDIAQAAERHLNIDGFAEKFEGYMARGFYSLSSPVWANFGRERGLPISCNGVYIADTMESILEKQCEVGMQTKHGSGTSAYFGDLRGRGESISAGGSSSGPVHFMELFDTVTSVVSQSNVRRGSFAAYLPIDHSDIQEFLRIRKEGNAIQEMSFGVTITDEWMQSMIDGDPEKRSLWGQIIKKRFETGYPYIMFKDNANNQAPKHYRDQNKTIHASNLCVTGDQRVVSDRGLLTVKELYEEGGELTLFDNQKTVKSSPMTLIEENAEVIKIELENGMTHKITPYHKISTKDGMVEAKDLKIGSKVEFQNKRGLFGKNNMQKEAFLLGMYQADGTQHKDMIYFDVWENDFDLLDEIKESHDYVCEKYDTQIGKFGPKYDKPNFVNCNTAHSTVKKKRLGGKACKKALNFEKGYIPDWIWSANEATQWQYVRGLYYSDGTARLSNSAGEPLYLSIANINKSFLKELQILLTNLGINSSLSLMRKAGKTLLPDGKGGEKLYNTKNIYRLVTGSKNDGIIFNDNTGFLSRKGVNLTRNYRDNSKKFHKVKSIRQIPNENVYCVKVDSDEHLWVCNGIVTSNCSEIMLPSTADESFVCCLSSLNLLHWDEIVKTDAVETLVYFLDAVMEEYIQKTENIPFMEPSHDFAKRHRALGMGVLGWHSLLQSKMLSFESLEAKILNNEIFKTIKKSSDEATESLGFRLGEPAHLKGYGRRNTTTLAIAPTTSSSFILGQISPSIEPLNSNYFVKGLAKGKFTYRNPHLKEFLELKGMDNDETWRSILTHGGSVQHLSFMTQDEKDVFKTFGEISQKEIVIQASQRQKYIDQGQSLNLMVPPEAPAREVSQLMILGWELGLKSYYYQRSANPSQELSRSIMNCASCEG